jgi:hypothetical protein
MYSGTGKKLPNPDSDVNSPCGQLDLPVNNEKYQKNFCTFKKRLMIENSKIIEIVNKIVLKVKPEKIFLSFASDNPNHDKDLLLIQVSKLPSYYRVLEIKKIICSIKPTHFIIFACDKFGNGEEINDKLKTSKLIYEST